MLLETCVHSAVEVLGSETHQMAPLPVTTQHVRVSDDDQQRHSTCDGNVEPRWIVEESNARAHAMLARSVCRCTPPRR